MHDTAPNSTEHPGHTESQIIGILTEHDFMVRAVTRHAFRGDREFQRFSSGSSELTESRTLDYLFATSHEPHEPRGVFDRLRWGGQFIFASREARETQEVADRFKAGGFLLEHPPACASRRILGLPFLTFGPRVYYFVARKVLLIPPGETTSRFTYDVRLVRDGPGFVVVKRIPEIAMVVEQLRARNPSAGSGELERMARKLVSGVFPVFLTREAAFLQILQRDLPEPYRKRVPTALDDSRNGRGMVRELRLNWLRKTDKTMGQLEFARQAADLLAHIHNDAKIIHLDLRLDNFVITDDGVGFVDFGSAARMGEDIAASPLLQRLFSQLMHTSQIQRVLENMTRKGKVTSRYMTDARHKVHPAADLFFLVMQIERPDSNPYTRELVEFDPQGPEARVLTEFRRRVLCPPDPGQPEYTSAQHVHKGLAAIHNRMRKSGSTRG